MSSIPWRDNGLLVAAFGLLVFGIVASTEFVFQTVSYQEPVLHFDLQVNAETDTEEDDDSENTLSESDELAVRTMVTTIVKQKDSEVTWLWLRQQFPQTKNEIWLDLALSLSNRRYPNTAKIILNELLNIDAGWLPAQYQLAKLLSSQGSSELAIKTYQDLLSLHPNHQASMINLGLLLARENRHQQAIAVQTRAIDISSGIRKAKAYSIRGSSQFELKNYLDAVNDFNSSIEFRPTHAPTWRKLANALLFASANEQEVILAFDQAINLQTDYLQALHERGRFYWLAGDYRQAREDFEKVKAVAPDYVSARWSLLHLYLHIGKNRSAEEEIRWFRKQDLKANELSLVSTLELWLNEGCQKIGSNFATLATESPEDYWLKYYDVSCSLSQSAGLSEDRFNTISPSLQILIKDPWMSSLGNLALSQAYLKNQQNELAFNVLQELTQRFTRSHHYAYLLGKTYLDADLYLQAASALERAIKLDDSDSQTRLSLGIAYRRGEQSQLALKTYEDLLNLRPSHRSGRYNYALLLEELDRLEEAQQQYQQLLELDATNTNAMYRLAILLVDQEQFENARQLLSDALGERPTFHRARELLVEILYTENQLDLALNEVNRLIVLESNRRSSKHLKSDILRDQNKLEQAAEVLISIPKKQRSRNTLVKMYNIGKRALDANQLQLAEVCNATAIDSDPNYDKAWVNLSSAYNRGQKYQQTIDLLVDKNELLTINHKLVINLAQAYHLSGDSDNAIALLQPLENQNLLSDEGKIVLSASYQNQQF